MNASPASAVTGGFAGNVWKNGTFVRAAFHIKNGRIYFKSRYPVTQAEYIIPPFTDPHIHGGWGWDVHQGHFLQLEKHLVRQGIFCAVPTLDNHSFETLAIIGAEFAEFQQRHPQSIFPFLRSEGPFISSLKKGFQNSSWIQKITSESLDRFFAIPGLGMVSFAPELERSDDLVRRGLEGGVRLSVGHSRATFKEFMQVYKLGVKHFTHYPNAMSEMHHREIGLTGAGLLLSDVQLEVISDGIHTSRDFLSLLQKFRGDSFALTSDLIPPAFSKLDHFDGRKIIVQGMKITTEDGTLAGGATPVSHQVARLYKWGWPPDSLVRMACENARTHIGLPLPTLEDGHPADFLILDRNMNLSAVYKQGRLVSEGE
jgi:N-acetylglucosamine-6-phosphate deacetylase